MCFQAHQIVYQDGFVDGIRPTPAPTFNYNPEPPTSTPYFQPDPPPPVSFPSFPPSSFPPDFDNETYVGNNETTMFDINPTYPTLNTG